MQKPCTYNFLLTFSIVETKFFYFVSLKLAILRMIFSKIDHCDAACLILILFQHQDTALHVAVWHGFPRIVRALCKAGSCVTYQNEVFTLLFYVAQWAIFNQFCIQSTNIFSGCLKYHIENCFSCINMEIGEHNQTINQQRQPNVSYSLS